MKKIFLSLLVLPFLTSCSSNNRHAEKNIRLVKKYIQSVENLDYKTMESLLDDTYYGYGPSFGDSIGKAQVVEYWKHNVENLYESIQYKLSRNTAVTIKDGDNKGDWVSNWGELHIVYKNGKDVTLWANTIYKIENSKIVKSYTFYNEADALKQLGYVFINPDDL
jgi:predicted ester cyclase